MQPTPALDSESVLLKWASLLHAFDMQDRRAQSLPRLDDFLKTAPTADRILGPAEHRLLLEHLVEIDLEKRWRHAADSSGTPALTGSRRARSHRGRRGGR